MMTVRKRAVLSTAIAILMGLVALPAHAAPGDGVLVIRCVAKLPNYPAPNGTGGTCNGVVTGAIVTSGVQTTLWDAPLSMAFSYNEPLSTCPLQGIAHGTFSINGGQISGDFTWTRPLYAPIFITLSGVDGRGLTNASGNGEAVLDAPDMTSNCLAGGGPLTGSLYASLSVFDTT